MTATAMMTPREQLRALLQELNFKGMARVLDDELDGAERDAVPVAEVLRRLLTEQALYRISATTASPSSASARRLPPNPRWTASTSSAPRSMPLAWTRPTACATTRRWPMWSARSAA